jgi:2-aminobenzoate-CoA ligase
MSAPMSAASGHVDPFAREQLPPRERWPELLCELPELQFPARLNCGAALLDRAAERHGSRPAVRAAGLCWSYAEYLARANRIARVLVEDMGLVPGNRVLLHGPNTPQLAACWFAALKAGAVPVPTMPLLRAHELALIIEKARISHALADGRLAAEVEAARRLGQALRQVRYYHSDSPDGLERRAQAKPEHFDNADTAADDVALIAFTSGTSGVPKGTMHLHRDVMATCECFPRSVLCQRETDVVAGTPPLAFTYGLGGLVHFPARFGACSVLVEQYAPQALLEAVARFGVTVLYTAPTMYRAMTPAARAHDLSSLRACVSAGEWLPAATRSAWEQASGAGMIDGIGASEMLYIFISAAHAETRPGATGKAIPGYRATVLNARGEPCAPGVVGRLAVKGPTGCRYLADERQSAYVQNGWNVTGDAYRMDEDGYFWYQARTDDMIISAGYNIAAPEVENALAAHPAVAECAVVGAPDERRGQIVKAFVVLRPGYAGDEAMVCELQEHAKGAIAPYKYPRAIEFLPALPRTPTGKVQRFRLRQLAG